MNASLSVMKPGMRNSHSSILGQATLSRTAGLAFCGLLLISSALAASADDPNDIHSEALSLDSMTVVSTRSARQAEAITASVDVVGSAAIEDQMIHDLPELVRYLPGLDIDSDGSRFGDTGYRIRGLGGNRVSILVDGIPIADQFSIGSFSNAGRDHVDPAMLRRVEFLRGPASALYGSDAIAGVVSYQTWMPAQWVSESDVVRTRLSSSVHSVDDSASVNLLSGWANSDQGWMLSATRSEGHEHDSSNRHLPDDPMDSEQSSVLARYSFNSRSAGELTTTLESRQSERQTTIRSILGQGRFRHTTALAGDDESTRRRLSLNWQLPLLGDWLDDAQLSVYRQTLSTTQWTEETRAAQQIRRDRQFDFDHDVEGISAQMEFPWHSGRLDHRFIIGGQWQDAEVRERRDAIEFDLVTGAQTRVLLGETFPVRDFPISRIGKVGLYVQDEIEVSDTGWSIIPGLRLDRIRLNPRGDTIFDADNPDTELVRVHEQEWTPRLGVLYQDEHVNHNWQFYAHYAEGFRAPPFEDANIGLDIPLFNIRAIPNPDLKSEQSQTLEFGYRLQRPGFRMALTVFDSHYQDFIQTRVNLGPDPETGVILFQSKNLDRARIRGVDLSASWSLFEQQPRLGSVSLGVESVVSRGRNTISNQPLNSISPAEALVRLDWQSPDDAWAGTLATRLVRARGDLDRSTIDQFAAPGYSTIDVMARYRINSITTLRLGLFNATDKRYWDWGSVESIDRSDPIIDLLSAPGRQWSASVTVEL